MKKEDKIELLKRLNELLETINRAIIKSYLEIYSLEAKEKKHD